MSSLLKIVVSLLITVLLFSVFYATSLPQVSSLLETRYYQKAVATSILKRADEASLSLDSYIKNEKKVFAEYTLNSFVESYLLANPSEVDSQMRSKVTGDLFTSTSGLLGLRFLDANGRYVHYSSFSKDTLSKTEKSVEYINYNDIKGEVAFSTLLPFDTGIASRTIEELSERVKVVYDSESDKNGRLIFCVPFYDSLSVFRGFLAFYVSASDFPRYLMSEKKIALDSSFSLLSNAENNVKGFLFGLPTFSSDANKALRILIEKSVSEKWKSGNENMYTLNSVGEDDESWILFSSQSKNGAKIGWVYKSDIFALSSSLRLFFLICASVVLYLIIFLLICLIFRDKMQIVRKRVKKLQFQIIKDYLEKKEKVDWSTIQESIQLQKSDFSAQIKEAIGRTGKKKSRAIDELLEHSWQDILSVLGAPGGSTKNVPFTLEQLRKMLSEVLSSVSERPVNVVYNQVAKDFSDTPPAPVVKTIVPNASEDVDTLDEVEELDQVEELSDDVEEAEAVEDIEEVEEIEEAEELSEEVEELDEVEEAEPIKKEADCKEDTEEEYVATEFENEFDRVTEEVRNAEKAAEEQRETNADVEEFSYEKPDFSFLDVSDENSFDEEEYKDIGSLEPIDDNSESSCSFTLFKIMSDTIEELESPSIVEKDGVYVVSPDLDIDKEQKNEGLMELVNSVRTISEESK